MGEKKKILKPFQDGGWGWVCGEVGGGIQRKYISYVKDKFSLYPFAFEQLITLYLFTDSHYNISYFT